VAEDELRLSSQFGQLGIERSELRRSSTGNVLLFLLDEPDGGGYETRRTVPGIAAARNALHMAKAGYLLTRQVALLSKCDRLLGGRALPATRELGRWAFDSRSLSARLGSVVKSIPRSFWG
jgi:hypothetical protein